MDFHFQAGQFNMVYLLVCRRGAHLPSSGDPDEPESFVHTIRAVGAVAKAMGAAKVGDTLGVRGPLEAVGPYRKPTAEIF